MTKLIECRDLSLSYEGVRVVSDINITVSQGDYICVIGENGSGKSTLMKALLGLIKPSGGEIVFSGGLKQTEIGYLPQQTAIQRDFPATCLEVVLSGTLRLNGIGFRYTAAQKALARENMAYMGISELEKVCYHELSGGQQQRVLLARALSATVKLLLLDEPAAGLDPIVTAELYNLLKKINSEKNLTVIMVSHDLAAVLSDAGLILHLAHEQLYFGTAEGYKNSEAAKEFFNNTPSDRLNEGR